MLRVCLSSGYSIKEVVLGIRSNVFQNLTQMTFTEAKFGNYSRGILSWICLIIPSEVFPGIFKALLWHLKGFALNKSPGVSFENLFVDFSIYLTRYSQRNFLRTPWKYIFFSSRTWLLSSWIALYEKVLGEYWKKHFNSFKIPQELIRKVLSINYKDSFSVI